MESKIKRTYSKHILIDIAPLNEKEIREKLGVSQNNIRVWKLESRLEIRFIPKTWSRMGVGRPSNCVIQSVNKNGLFDLTRFQKKLKSLIADSQLDYQQYQEETIQNNIKTSIRKQIDKIVSYPDYVLIATKKRDNEFFPIITLGLYLSSVEQVQRVM